MSLVQNVNQQGNKVARLTALLAIGKECSVVLTVGCMVY